MDVSCPSCRAHLILPSHVAGQSVCCPKCRAVLRAEADRLVTSEGIVASPPAPRPTGAVEVPPDAEDSRLDLAIPRGHVFPGQRHAEILRTLSSTGTWMRIVAAADLLSVFLVAALAHLAVDSADLVAGLICALAVVGPIAVLLWIAGSALSEYRLHGSGQQAALVLGLVSGGLVGTIALVGIMAAWALPVQGRFEMLIAMVIVGALALATFLVSLIAVRVRRQAIAASIARHIDDLAEDDADDEALPAGPAALYRSPQQIARSAAKSLRRACLVLVLWYPLRFSCCCVSPHADPRTYYWFLVVSAAGLLPLSLMLGGAYYLEQLRRRGIVIAGSVAALLVSAGFTILFLVSLAHLTTHHGGNEVPFVLLRGAVALAVALSSLIGGIQTWQAVHEPAVRRAFARN